jgi:hypothetical protein
MITICKNLFRHKGQGVVWNGPHGPVKGHIKYAVRRFDSPDKQVTFIVECDRPEKGGVLPRSEEKTAAMLYPNMKAWLKWKADLMRNNIATVRGRVFNKKMEIMSLLKAATELNCTSYGTLGFTSRMRDMLQALSDTMGGRGVTMPLCDTVRDEELISEMEAELRSLTAWERRQEKKRKAYEEWKKKQEVKSGEV